MLTIKQSSLFNTSMNPFYFFYHVNFLVTPSLWREPLNFEWTSESCKENPFLTHCLTLVPIQHNLTANVWLKIFPEIKSHEVDESDVETCLKNRKITDDPWEPDGLRTVSSNIHLNPSFRHSGCRSDCCDGPMPLLDQLHHTGECYPPKS